MWLLLSAGTILLLSTIDYANAAKPGSYLFSLMLQSYSNPTCDDAVQGNVMNMDPNFQYTRLDTITLLSPSTLIPITSNQGCVDVCERLRCQAIKLVYTKRRLFCTTAQQVQRKGDIMHRTKHMAYGDVDFNSTWLRHPVTRDLPSCLQEQQFLDYLNHVLMPTIPAEPAATDLPMTSHEDSTQSPSQSTPIKVSSTSSVSSTKVSTMADSQTPSTPAITKGHTDDVKITETHTVCDNDDGGETEEGTKTTASRSIEKETSSTEHVTTPFNNNANTTTTATTTISEGTMRPESTLADRTTELNGVNRGLSTMNTETTVDPITSVSDTLGAFDCSLKVNEIHHDLRSGEKMNFEGIQSELTNTVIRKACQLEIYDTTGDSILIVNKETKKISDTDTDVRNMKFAICRCATLDGEFINAAGNDASLRENLI